MERSRVEDMRLTIRNAEVADQDTIIYLAQRVQDNLTARGSVQHIGPLEQETVTKACDRRGCYVLERYHSPTQKNIIIGCALARSLEPGYFVSTSSFNMERFASPWLYLHSIMLKPDHRGQGLGNTFVTGVIEMIAKEQASGGTLFLDCWAGNDKLRGFYSRVGFQFAAVVPEDDYEIAVFHRPMHASDAESG